MHRPRARPRALATLQATSATTRRTCLRDCSQLRNWQTTGRSRFGPSTPGPSATRSLTTEREGCCASTRPRSRTTFDKVGSPSNSRPTLISRASQRSISYPRSAARGRSPGAGHGEERARRSSRQPQASCAGCTSAVTGAADRWRRRSGSRRLRRTARPPPPTRARGPDQRPRTVGAERAGRTRPRPRSSRRIRAGPR